MSSITAELVRELLLYDPQTGLFTWRVSRGRAPAGAAAGTRQSRGYLQIRISRKNYLAHRLAWLYVTGEFPCADIDHINGVTDDNRFGNLRSVSHQANKRNVALYRNNKSGIAGVRYVTSRGQWVAQIVANESRLHLGYFNSIEDAQIARKNAEAKYGYHPNHGRAT